MKIFGSKKFKPISFIEKKGSAQIKSSVIFAGMRSDNKTIIKAKKSRNHTELMCKYLNLPIKVNVKKNYDEIIVNKVKQIQKLYYNIPSDISSGAFFMVLTALTENSKINYKKCKYKSIKNWYYYDFKKNGCKNNFSK